MPPVPTPAFPLPPGYELAKLKLSEQLMLFVELFRTSGDAMAAAVRAKMSDPRWPIDVLAQKTLERPEVQEAIRLLDLYDQQKQEAEIRAKREPTVRQPVTVTKDTLVADLREIYESAKDDKAYGAAIAAAKTSASILGLLKQEVNVNFRMTVEEMPDEELLKIARQGGKMIDADFEDVTPTSGRKEK